MRSLRLRHTKSRCEFERAVVFERERSIAAECMKAGVGWFRYALRHVDRMQPALDITAMSAIRAASSLTAHADAGLLKRKLTPST